MHIRTLIARELWHHRGNTFLALLGLAIASGMLVAVHMTSNAAERETRRVMRDLGFNLRILPGETDMEHFWATGYSDKTLPQESVDRLAKSHGVFLTFNHLTPSLERHFSVGGRDVLLTGLGSAIVGPGEGKQPMGFKMTDGQLFIGFNVGQRLQVRRGDPLELGGKQFTVERVLAESGTEDDVRIFSSLSDAQTLLGLPGQINEIKAIDCLCLTGDDDPLSQLREVVGKILPEAMVLQLRTMADARARQRQMAERLAKFAVPVALVATAAWVGLLALLNVRERRPEIGLWRALGYSTPHIAGLFLGRHLLLGVIAGILGFGMGTALALQFGPRIFQVTAGSLAPNFSLLVWALVLTPLFALLASFLPAMRAVAQDPADTLRND